MARHRPNRRRIKRHRTYAVDEAAKVLGVAKGTVRRWLKDGLPAIKERRPTLILGEDLAAYLEAQAKPKSPCRLNELFCFRCRTPRLAAGNMFDYLPRTASAGRLTALCGVCETVMHKAISARAIPDLRRMSEVSFPRAQGHISEMPEPFLNDHFGQEASQ
jgi:excisionase family DNA binding protein